MESSKVKSLTPVMSNGTHETWNGTNGTFFKFNLELENGHKGGVL